MRTEQRLDRLERAAPRRWSPAARRLAAHFAETQGIPVAEVIAGTERFLADAEAAGMASTLPDLCAFAARETGLPADALLAEVEADMAAWKETTA